MALDPLVTILRNFEPHKPFLIDSGRQELTTRVALNAFVVTDNPEISLRDRLTEIRGSHSDLAEKITQFESLLTKVHEKTRADLENEIGLTDWDGGPNTEEGKNRIIQCFLNNQNRINNLDLSNLQLTSLPSCISNLNITGLNCSRNQLREVPPFSGSLRNIVLSNNLLSEIPALPPSAIRLSCNNNQLTNLPLLPESLAYLECNNNQLTNLPLLPGSIKQIQCDNNQLTILPIIPESVINISCCNNRLTVLPLVPRTCLATFTGNPLLGELPRDSILKFRIPKGGDSEPLWCRVLMNEIRQRHQGEDYSLVVGVYKMWGDEEASTITIKEIEGDEALVFAFDKSTGAFISVTNQNGIEVSLSELKEGDSWNAILNQFAESVLKEHGIQVEETAIKVHPEAIEKFPLEILKQLTPNMRNVRYLGDDFMPNNAIDVGGVSKQFISDLCKTFFIGSAQNIPLISVPEEGLLDFEEDKAEIYRNFGKIISFVLDNPNPLITGLYFNPNFYLLLKIAQSGTSENVLSAFVVKEILTNDEATIKALNWYNNPSSGSREDTITYLTNVYGSEFGAEPTDEQVRSEIESTVLEAGRGKAQVILKVLEGMTPSAKVILATTPDGELSARIQGERVTAENLKATIIMEEGLTPRALEKRDWILERIDEKAGDQKWLNDFVFFITGQPFLLQQQHPNSRIKLKFFDIPNFNAHTCFNMLDVPTNGDNKDDFLLGLDLCIQDPTSFNTF